MGFDHQGRGDLVIGVPRAAFRPSVIFLGLVALLVTAATMAWRGYGNPAVDVFLFVVAGWLVSLCLHEYGHALVAYRAGDVSVAARGYLTLNPLRYTHPVLSIVLPVVFLLLGGFGMPGGAVWVDRHAVRGGRGVHSLISFAGPATNLIFTLILFAPFALGVDTTTHAAFWAGLGFLAFLQLTASVLNLAPIPGVDGGNLIHPWLNAQWRRWYDMFAPYGMLLLFALLFQPRINRAFFGAIFAIANALGMPESMYWHGLDLVRFWSWHSG